MPKLFISHSSRDEKLVSRLRDLIVTALPITAADIRCTTLGGSKLPLGRRDPTLMKEAAAAGVFIGVISDNSILSQWVLFELAARRLAKKKLLLLLVGVDKERLYNGPLRDEQTRQAHESAELKELIEEIQKSLRCGRRPNEAAYQSELDAFIRAVPVQGAGAGKVARKPFLKSKKRQPDEVFAIELLKHPVSIERDVNRHITVTVNRDGVKNVLISNRGKADEVEDLVTEDNRDDLKQLDHQIQAFLAGGLHNPLTDGQPQLRWASGGVMSIVSFADEPNKKWVPLFFRDIRPYGWNISLGSTQRAFLGDKETVDTSLPISQEWRDPAHYIEREFLEESLVVVGEPSAGRTLPVKRFRWATGHAVSEAQATRFIKDHLLIRERDDSLSLAEVKGEEIELNPIRTPCSLVVQRAGEDDSPIHNVLVCFSLLDLGIEVVRVVSYVLQPGEWLLDGEILDKRSESGERYQELVRMPIVFLSLKYLKRTFGNGALWQNYTAGPQPSIEVLNAPKEHEIKFPVDWDVERRMNIINSSPGDEQRKNEKDRQVRWYDMFRSNFLDETGNHWRANASRLFVPGTAKIFNLYFNLMEKPRLAAKRKVKS